MSIGMELMTVLLLAVVQGVAEFLPISSSGHLVIVGGLLEEGFGGGFSPKANLRLNVALHFGTLLSILYVYRDELRLLPRKPLLCVCIVIATCPAAIVGLTFRSQLEEAFSTPLLAGCCLLVTAALLGFGQKLGRSTRPLDSLHARDALAIGLFQAVALLPGVSRSGSTIAGGLLTGFTREAAAAFSFLIAIPAIGGATVLMAKDLIPTESIQQSAPTANALSSAAAQPELEREGQHDIRLISLLIGVAVSALVGVFSLKTLLRLIVRRKLHWFAWYCSLVGIGTIVWQLSRSPG